MKLVPTEKEINEILEKCMESINKGKTQFHGMSYEEGVEHTIKWMIGEELIDPLED